MHISDDSRLKGRVRVASVNTWRLFGSGWFHTLYDWVDICGTLAKIGVGIVCCIIYISLSLVYETEEEEEVEERSFFR